MLPRFPKMTNKMSAYLSEISNYNFYFVEDAAGAYRFRGVRGNVYRRNRKDFANFMKHMPEKEKHLFTQLYGIADVERVDTGTHTLVYAIFADLQELSLSAIPQKMPSTATLLEQVTILEQKNAQLKKLLADNNILIIDMEEK